MLRGYRHLRPPILSTDKKSTKSTYAQFTNNEFFHHITVETGVPREDCQSFLALDSVRGV